LSKHPAVVAEGAEQAVAALRDTRFKPSAGLLDNTPITTGRYIAHIAVPCRGLEEAARWYAEVLEAQHLQLRRRPATGMSPGAACDRAAVRFPDSAHEHQTFMVVDPSGNVVEFKCYVRPECCY
jgi:hypothetical protein